MRIVSFWLLFTSRCATLGQLQPFSWGVGEVAKAVTVPMHRGVHGVNAKEDPSQMSKYFCRHVLKVRLFPASTEATSADDVFVQMQMIEGSYT